MTTEEAIQWWLESPSEEREAFLDATGADHQPGGDVWYVHPSYE